MNQFDILMPEGAVFCLYLTRKKKTVAWAWVEYVPEPIPSEKLNKVRLLDIICLEHLQRRGYASEVIKMLQGTHNSIETNASFSTSAGAMLMLKHGFKRHKTTNKKESDTYIWTKESNSTEKEG